MNICNRPPKWPGVQRTSLITGTLTEKTSVSGYKRNEQKGLCPQESNWDFVKHLL